MKYRRWYMLPVLLVAAGLRLYGLSNLSPPGLAHDEVAHWLINRSILAGNHAVYFTEAYGHEAGFHYVQAAFGALLGDNALALRLPAAFAGILLVAACFALVRLLFNWRVALIAASFQAVLFWPVFYSRQGLRAISLPLVSAFSAYAWWRGMALIARGRSALSGANTVRPGTLKLGPSAWMAIAGLLAGLSLYTYMAARAVPIFYGLFVIYLLLVDRKLLFTGRRSILLFGAALALVAAPLALFLLGNPGAEFRISEVDAPLRALREGNLLPVLENSLRALGLFGIRGDPLWRQNVAPQPAFGPAIALLSYAGLLLCLWRWRDRRYAFVVLWVAVSLIPSIVTIDAPSTIRMINALALLTALPALVIHSFYRLSTIHPQLSTRSGITSWITLLTMALVLFNLGRTSVWIFHTWPANQEVQFVWQQALTHAAEYLDSQPEAGPAAVGGWTPETMDPPTMELTLRREDLALRYFNPTEGVIVPAGGSARITYPTILPLSLELRSRLEQWGGTGQAQGDFTLYTLSAEPQPAPEFPADVTFRNELQFLGHDVEPGCLAERPENCLLITYWRVLGPATSPRRFFVHLLDEQGRIVAQDDRNSAPAAYWQAGDLIVQQHTIDASAVDQLLLRIGVYDPDTGLRLSTDQGQDSVALPPALEE